MTTQSDKSPEVVDVLDHAQWCSKCGYAMQGQPLVHEPHYGFIVAKCPECATVRPIEAMQMSRSQARGMAITRGSRILLGLFAWLVLSTGLNIFVASETAIECSRQYADRVAGFIGGNSYATFGEDVLQPKLDADWIQAGGLIRVVDWTEAGAFLLLFPSAFISGLIALACFPTLRLRGNSVLACTAVLLSHLIFAGMVWADWQSGVLSPYRYAIQRVAYPLSALALVAAFIPTWLTLICVRPVLRWFIGKLADPVLTARMTALWTIDGYPPPINIEPLSHKASENENLKA